jgi:hypothetical protein
VSFEEIEAGIGKYAKRSEEIGERGTGRRSTEKRK